MKRNTKMAGRELRQEQAIASGGGMRRGKRELTEEKVGHDLAWAEEAPATARTALGSCKGSSRTRAEAAST